MARLGLVIFDLDGTLLDTIEDLGAAVDHALLAEGFPTHTTDEYRRMVGHGIRNLVTVALPEDRREDDALIGKCLGDFREYYTEHIDDLTLPYPGIPELLSALNGHGIKIAIATNKFQAGTERLIRGFFPGIPFSSILGNREGFPLKPDPEIVGEALREAGVKPDEAVMVGDSMTDIKTALNGGIRPVAVNWGYRQMKTTGEFPVVSTVSELEEILLVDEHHRLGD